MKRNIRRLPCPAQDKLLEGGDGGCAVAPAFPEGKSLKLKRTASLVVQPGGRPQFHRWQRGAGAAIWEHPYGEAPTESKASRGRLRLIGVKFTISYFMPNATSYLAIIGDIKPERAKKYFGAWERERFPGNFQAPGPSEPVVAFVDKRGSAVGHRYHLSGEPEARHRSHVIITTVLLNTLLGRRPQQPFEASIFGKIKAIPAGFVP